MPRQTQVEYWAAPTPLPPVWEQPLLRVCFSPVVQVRRGLCRLEGEPPQDLVFFLNLKTGNNVSLDGEAVDKALEEQGHS
jgi:hypothetical protein